MKARLPFVQKFKDRQGRMRYYFRRGKVRVPLPDPAKGWPTFMAAYQRAAHGLPTTAHPSGTMASLLDEYLASPAFRNLKPASQTLYRRVVDFLRKRPSAAAPVAAIRRKHITTLRDELADTPAMANVTLSVVTRLMAYAVEQEYRDDNPAAGIARFKTGEHRAWTADEHAAFRERWPAGSMQRRAYMLALFTGQRRGDLASMTWNDRRDGLIHVVQEKTGTDLWIPEHRDLAAELARATERHVTILHAARSGFTPERLGDWFAAAIDAAKLPDECVLHGLRKSATAALADAGCSEREIMAITGHKTPDMVTHYAKAADQKRMSRAAVKKWEDGA